MRRLVPYPLLAAGLLTTWLLLNQSLSAGQVLLGAAVTLFALRATAALNPEKVRIKAWLPIVRLVGVVSADIIRSNVAVARIIVSPRRRDRVSGFVRLPLDMTSRYGLAVLACIITATPGTLWVQFDRNTGQLLVHVLDLIDEEQWIQLIKHRYERLLMEIFE